ncbi:pancreatic lipase-related protein 2-like isoform X2 [Bacillus rossius redtenbacheri]|uniref:pancreatic lipase-related protein 2-like isoform X2 n=1 Tax=Bacillus rossius redtenbacheri TaxID=93214 RepID=UPI002FDD63A8
MAVTRGVVLALLLAGLCARCSALVVGKVVKTIHDAAHTTGDVLVDTVEKIPVVGGVAGTLTASVADAAHDVAATVGEHVGDTVQAGLDAVAPATPCYEHLGCFPMMGPWWSLDRLVPAPQTPEDIETRFYLYTRAQPERYYIQTRPNVSVDGSDYNGNRVTVMITHGFASNGNSSWLEEMKDAVLNKIDANVIIVDWGKGSSKLNYFQVSANTRVVGAEIARVCLYLQKNHSMSPKRLHLIGHSLGAHIMSYVSKNVTRIARITGLDPAQPLFEDFPNEVLLDPSDAVFVDIVHTDAEQFLPFLGLGVVKAHGHVDFYVNGGNNQPGCSLKDLIKPNITSIAQLATTLVEVRRKDMPHPAGSLRRCSTRCMAFASSHELHFAARTGAFGAHAFARR